MIRSLALILSCLLPLLSIATTEDDLLPPKQAFQMKAEVEDPATLRIDWNIADGYYLYRSKFKVTSRTSGIELGDPQLPPGKIKQDEFFGDIETYRHQISMKVPVKRAPGSSSAMQLEAVSQGCADVGVCYPPQVYKAALQLPVPVSAAQAEPKSSLEAIAEFSQSLGLTANEDNVLPPEEAFKVTAEPLDGDTIIARWQIANEHYLYKDKFKFALTDTTEQPLSVAAIKEVKLPQGKEKVDEFFGRIQVYYHEVEAQIHLSRSSIESLPVQLQTGYQGCAERGICYPPLTHTIALTLPPVASTGGALVGPTAQPQPPLQSQQVISEQDRLAQSLSTNSTWLIILSFLGFGLLLAFTPCVFPMIPILSSLIVGQGEKITTAKAFALSLTYVLAMAVTYTAAGIIAGMFGSNLQAAFQDPWVLVSFAGIFVLLSLSMFGFYELQMPASIQSRLTSLSNSQAGGTYLGVAIMGFLSALIVGPCVAPPLAGALIYIGQTGDAVLGGTALFALSMGMGAPLLVIGASAGKLLPHAGGWMNAVKAVFGVLLLGVAVWLLERVLPGPITMVLWALLLIIPAIYLGALEPVEVEATGWKKLWKGLGLVMLIYGGLLLVGAASGSRDVFQPLKLLAASPHSGSAASIERSLAFTPVKSVADVKKQIAQAAAEGRPVMLDFYADWCVSCKEMERYTFSDPEVQRSLAEVTLLQADVTANDATDQALLKHFDLVGPPSILFFGADGQEQRGYRLVGFLPADKFQAHVTQATQIERQLSMGQTEQMGN